MAAVVSSTDVPNSIQEALDDPTWKAAVKGIRLSGRQQNLGTCSKTSEPEDHQRQVAFFVKHGADGEILKYKARYVAKGFTQIFGVDYNETYSPIVRLTSLRLLELLSLSFCKSSHE